MVDGKTYRDQWAALEKGTGFTCFKDVPAPGDALYVGLSEAVPSNAVRLRFSCHIEGVGVDPTNPPLAWEAWSGEDWEPCELDSDSTGGLNRDGDVIIHVPRSHTASLIAKQRAGWIRARVTEPDRGPARLQRLAEHHEPDRDHDRRHRRRRQRRAGHGRGRRHLRGRAR